jgi:AcrR family transcriptional regulator
MQEESEDRPAEAHGGAQWRRARQPGQKRQRRRQILSAAAQLYERSGPEEMSFSGIAREAGLAKSNLYRYFESLEEILLTLFLHDFDELLEALTSRQVQRREGPQERREAAEERRERIAALAAEIAGAVEEHPRFAALLSQLSGVMERPLSRQVAERFKREVSRRSGELAGWLTRRLPELEEERAAQSMLAMHAMIAGFWPMSRPSPVMEGVLELPELQHLRVRFRHSFAETLAAYLRGSIAETGR